MLSSRAFDFTGVEQTLVPFCRKNAGWPIQLYDTNCLEEFLLKNSDCITLSISKLNAIVKVIRKQSTSNLTNTIYNNKINKNKSFNKNIDSDLNYKITKLKTEIRDLTLKLQDVEYNHAIEKQKWIKEEYKLRNQIQTLKAQIN